MNHMLLQPAHSLVAQTHHHLYIGEQQGCGRRGGFQSWVLPSALSIPNWPILPLSGRGLQLCGPSPEASPADPILHFTGGFLLQPLPPSSNAAA
jgi:hypothetical protein